MIIAWQKHFQFDGNTFPDHFLYVWGYWPHYEFNPCNLKKNPCTLSWCSCVLWYDGSCIFLFFLSYSQTDLWSFCTVASVACINRQESCFIKFWALHVIRREEVHYSSKVATFRVLAGEAAASRGSCSLTPHSSLCAVARTPKCETLWRNLRLQYQRTDRAGGPMKQVDILRLSNQSQRGGAVPSSSEWRHAQTAGRWQIYEKM